MPHTITVPALPPAPSEIFQMGTARGPGGTIQADGVSLLRDGKRWVPTMGEFHYARYPAAEWREELLKLKAGGIDIIATYVFWIHHEEIEGKWRWDGQRALRRFVSLCKEVGMPVVLRVGPWCHGEVRNGGFPDWLLKKKSKTRSDDPGYLAKARELYAQIAAQAKGLLWKEGGPIVGLQVENEYGGKAEHLLTLKRLAREVGFDVPLYTRTGWPGLSTPMPFGEILPLYGAYPEGFWDRTTEPMPSQYWRGFAFDLRRTDEEIGNERQTNAGDETHAKRYPFLTCEMGGGMLASYHRRIRIDPRDIESMILTKIASGSNLPGYYMAHGGTNPDGELSTLQEAQANHEWNDVPVKSYDFQTLLGEFGQTREQYHRLRRLHLFLRDWGKELAVLSAYLPEERPKGKEDDATLRWSVRSDGRRGFVFVNNYQRLHPMPAKEDVRLRVTLPSGPLDFSAVAIPADSTFFWPFNLPLGGTILRYATAQPICRLGDTVVFAATKGVPTEFTIAGGKVLGTTGRVEGNRIVDIQPGRGAAVRLLVGNRITTIVVLEEADSFRLYKGSFAGRERLVLSSAGVVFDKGLRLRTSDAGSPAVLMMPAPSSLKVESKALAVQKDGLFGRFDLPWAPSSSAPVDIEKIRDAAPPRTIENGSEGVAEAPTDADFAGAAVWRLRVQPLSGRLLRIRYKGDVARLYEGDRLLTDDFSNGKPFEFGTWRAGGDLRLEVLPLRKDAPIMFLDRPTEDAVARLDGVDVIEERTLSISP